MVRVHVDPKRCEGTGFCVQVSEDLFTLNDEGLSAATARELTPDEVMDAEEAQDMCPTRAIQLTADQPLS